VPGRLDIAAGHRGEDEKLGTRSMEPDTLLAAIVLCSVVPCIAQQQTATMEIRMPESRIAAGSPIRLDVIVKNLSTQNLHVWKAEPHVDGQAEAYTSVEVRGSNGNRLQRIDGPAVVRNGKTYRLPRRWLTRKGVYVEAHQVLRDFLVLSELFDLSMPGAYTVSPHGDFQAPDSGSEVKWVVAESSQIRFTVK
jgi:hypothetical protein